MEDLNLKKCTICLEDILTDIETSNIYKIIWYINKKDIWSKKIKYLWWIEDAHKYFENKKCDEILYIDSDFNKKELFELWELSRIFWIRYRYITKITRN